MASYGSKKEPDVGINWVFGSYLGVAEIRGWFEVPRDLSTTTLLFRECDLGLAAKEWQMPQLFNADNEAVQVEDYPTAGDLFEAGITLHLARVSKGDSVYIGSWDDRFTTVRWYTEAGRTLPKMNGTIVVADNMSSLQIENTMKEFFGGRVTMEQTMYDDEEDERPNAHLHKDDTFPTCLPAYALKRLGPLVFTETVRSSHRRRRVSLTPLPWSPLPLSPPPLRRISTPPPLSPPPLRRTSTPPLRASESSHVTDRRETLQNTLSESVSSLLRQTGEARRSSNSRQAPSRSSNSSNKPPLKTPSPSKSQGRSRT